MLHPADRTEYPRKEYWSARKPSGVGNHAGSDVLPRAWALDHDDAHSRLLRSPVFGKCDSGRMRTLVDTAATISGRIPRNFALKRHRIFSESREQDLGKRVSFDNRREGTTCRDLSLKERCHQWCSCPIRRS